jgi:hypothetical protein
MIAKTTLSGLNIGALTMLFAGVALNKRCLNLKCSAQCTERSTWIDRLKRALNAVTWALKPCCLVAGESRAHEKAIEDLAAVCWES